MGTSTKLPFDILGHIADVLGADGSREINQHHAALSALKALCLTCKFMAPICRRHLFSSIRYSTCYGDLWRQNKLSEFLLSHPFIATHYTKNLHLDVRHPFSKLNYECLQKISDSSESSLTSVEILSSGSCSWNELPGKTKAIIISLIQVPTLRHLTVKRISDFPAATLSRCSGLNMLILSEVNSLSPPGTNDAIERLNLMTLVITWQSSSGTDNVLATLMGLINQSTTEAARPASIIAFNRLKYLSFKVRSYAEVSQMCKLLERAIRLERLEIYVSKPDIRLEGLGSSLAANPRPKLRVITLNLVDIHPQDNSPLLALDFELRQLSGRNVIEALEVNATGELDTVWSPDASGWAADFEQLITDVEAFPVLRKVSVCDVILPLNRGTTVTHRR